MSQREKENNTTVFRLDGHDEGTLTEHFSLILQVKIDIESLVFRFNYSNVIETALKPSVH